MCSDEFFLEHALTIYIGTLFQSYPLSLCNCKSYFYQIGAIYATHKAAASIWFEIWGLWIQVKKSIFKENFPKNRFFSGNITNKFLFSREKFPNVLSLVIRFEIS